MRHILPVIDGAVPAGFASLVRCHLDYHYLSQKTELSEDELDKILSLIQEFHNGKQIVLEKKFRKTLQWMIPKLASQHEIVPTIIALGALLGVSTDISEHEHIQMVKEPFRHTNHRDFYKQMINFLSRLERLRFFDLVTAMTKTVQNTGVSFHSVSGGVTDEDGSLTQWLDNLNTVQSLRGSKRKPHTNYFKLVSGLTADERRIRRIRTFVPTSFTAIHLNRDPSVSTMSIDEAAIAFDLPELADSIREYFHPSQQEGRGPIISRRYHGNRLSTLPPLSFNTIRIWYKVKVQTKSLFEPGLVNKAATLFAEPPSSLSEEEEESLQMRQSGIKLQDIAWIRGRYDCALFVNDMSKHFEGRANLKGEIPSTY